MMQDKCLRGVSIAALVFLCITIASAWAPISAIFGGFPEQNSFAWFLLQICFPFAILFYVVPYLALISVLGAASILGIKGAKTNSQRGLLWSSVLGCVGSALCFADLYLVAVFLSSNVWPNTEPSLSWGTAFGFVRALLFLGVGVCSILARRQQSKSNSTVHKQNGYQKLMNV